MQALLSLSRMIDAVTRFIGQSVSWLLLAAVLISAGNAVIRKVFDMSSNAWLEIQWYLYGVVFLLAAAYALLNNEHVRIDIISSSWKKRTRDWVDLVLHVIFLLPFSSLMVWLAWPWFWTSFNSGEMSPNAGGLIIWPAKLAVLAGFILLTFQAVSEVIKRAAVIAGTIDDPRPDNHADHIAEIMENH
ncbi:TRAP transporter small permease subunit [Rhizobium sp. NRK18]|uniref:TRAP transporter small permease subunit n=1 Tax=Rhizobium sp. NRK18 TaxID=2964667 RepID=UPI0021C49FAA|nr:TRAP transporter small permease subunit [Rhizobium sp. NRK18]MCQ2002716.1 TRAP transporter small permease subunit [Rhizobium sp. NRK18]